MRFCDRARYGTISLEALEGILDRLGINKGAHLYIHSGVADLLSRKPSGLESVEYIRHIIERLQVRISSGSIMMPAFPFSGRSLDYYRNKPLFNPLADLGTKGFMTEVFAEMPGVIRSAHPSESTLGWGAIDRKIFANHHRLSDPTTKDSPMGWLVRKEGLILHIGIPYYKAISLIHYVDGYLNRECNYGYLSSGIFPATVILKDGESYSGNYRCYNQHIFDRRIFYDCMGSENLIVTGLKGIPFSILDTSAGFDRAVSAGRKALAAGRLPPWILSLSAE